MCRGTSGASVLLWADGHVPLGEDGSASNTSVADRAHCEDHRLSAAVHVWRMGDICAQEGAPAKVDLPGTSTARGRTSDAHASVSKLPLLEQTTNFDFTQYQLKRRESAQGCRWCWYRLASVLEILRATG